MSVPLCIACNIPEPICPMPCGTYSILHLQELETVSSVVCCQIQHQLYCLMSSALIDLRSCQLHDAMQGSSINIYMANLESVVLLILLNLLWSEPAMMWLYPVYFSFNLSEKFLCCNLLFHNLYPCYKEFSQVFHLHEMIRSLLRTLLLFFYWVLVGAFFLK